jgi:formamidopyrimidine-DNA glycosylase
MNGKFLYEEGNHSHIRFDIEDDIPFSVYFDDTRYFGKIDIIDSSQESRYFANIGPCLLKHAMNEETWITTEEWKKIFKPKLLRRKMCDILIDQSIIAGIGQYLMVEILYFSGIHPKRIGNTITDEELELIRINSHKVVKLSYNYGGFTLRDFLSPSKTPGMYPAAVYGKTSDPNGYRVVKEKLTNGRSIHFVSELQKINK